MTLCNESVQVQPGAAWCRCLELQNLTALMGTCRCCQCLWESRAAWAVVRRPSRGRQAYRQPPKSAWCLASGAALHRRGPYASQRPDPNAGLMMRDSGAAFVKE